jgi:hypothetical protein
MAWNWLKNVSFGEWVRIKNSTLERSMDFETAISKSKFEKGKNKGNVGVTAYDPWPARMGYTDIESLLLQP